MEMLNMGSNKEKKALEKPTGEWVQVGVEEGVNGEENFGKFGINNDKIAYVTEGGVKYIAPYTKERETDLIMKGYENAGVGVPYSQGETMSSDDPDSIGWRYQKAFGGEIEKETEE